MSEFHPGNTSVVKLEGVRNVLTGEYVTDASVTVRIQDGQGADVSGPSWPIAMQYQAESNGDYYGVVPHDAGMAVGVTYRALVVATLPGGERGEWEDDVHVESRGAR